MDVKYILLAIIMCVIWLWVWSFGLSFLVEILGVCGIFPQVPGYISYIIILPVGWVSLFLLTEKIEDYFIYRTRCLK